MNVLAVNAMLAGPGLVPFMGEGSRMVLCDGAQPIDGGALTTIIAAAVLAVPAGSAADGALTLVQANPDGDLATATGIPTWGRVERADGTWIAYYSVSGPSGSGQVKVTVENPPPGDPEAKIYQGGTFFISEVKIGG
ncbi:hypothetical protein [Variovorax sp. CY25R-8]|uniref:hypothetical protein n=1 Tax=Variovorax sp. CY25R-8 TaxID=2855501 RepID=UPI0021BB1D88|nr:hypothetical protein [Variovorax sp. CY25R-8]MCT8174389.1 hypothetical protein [Variovorax sp. CY25R-8]